MSTDFETAARELHAHIRDTGLPVAETFTLKLRLRRPGERFTIDYYEGVGSKTEKRQRVEVDEDGVSEVTYFGEDDGDVELQRTDRFRDGVLVKLSQKRDGKKAGSLLVRNNKKGYWRHRVKGDKVTERLAKLESDHFDVLLGPAPGEQNELTTNLTEYVRKSESLAALGRKSRTFFEVDGNKVTVVDDDRVEHRFEF